MAIRYREPGQGRLWESCKILKAVSICCGSYKSGKTAPCLYHWWILIFLKRVKNWSVSVARFWRMC